jgi:hypothetical protein
VVIKLLFKALWQSVAAMWRKKKMGVTLRDLAEAMHDMELSDLSVLATVIDRDDRNAVLITSRGSPNDRFWKLLMERGWLVDQGNPRPASGLDLVSYSVKPDSWDSIGAVAICGWEAFRQGMTVDELLAFREGNNDPRLVHLLSPEARKAGRYPSRAPEAGTEKSRGHPDRPMLDLMYVMKPSDVSVMISAIQRNERNAVFVTPHGSANDRLWTLMVERGWFVDRGDPFPDTPLDTTSYSVRPGSWDKWKGFVICAVEAFRNGMDVDDLMVVFLGGYDKRLSRVLDARPR